MEQFQASSWEDSVLDRVVARKVRDGHLMFEMARRVSELKARADCVKFPTNVDRLATASGISKIRLASLPGRGRLLREPLGLVIEVNRSLSPEDRRFVIGHEIAHLLLERDSIDQSSRQLRGRRTRHALSYEQVERLCDFGAREILIPLSTLRYELRKSEPNLETVATIAKEANCSIHLVAERISEPYGIWGEVTFVWWRDTGSRFEIVRMIPPSIENVDLADGAQALIRKALLSGKAVRGRFELWVGANLRGNSAQVAALDSSQGWSIIEGRMPGALRA
jgi:Zn-dependent peptidase ImmA (M78 family)